MMTANFALASGSTYATHFQSFPIEEDADVETVLQDVLNRMNEAEGSHHNAHVVERTNTSISTYITVECTTTIHGTDFTTVVNIIEEKD